MLSWKTVAKMEVVVLLLCTGYIWTGCRFCKVLPSCGTIYYMMSHGGEGVLWMLDALSKGWGVGFHQNCVDFVSDGLFN